MGRHNLKQTQQNPPVIFLTGKSGQVGFELERLLAPIGQVVATDLPTLDLADPLAIREAVRNIKPDIIINPAAYTAVDRAESEPDQAHAVNAIAPEILAEEAKKLHIPIIHFSTDYVFDGAKSDPYLEEDTPNPTTVYGETKLQGEEAVRHSGAPYVIIRLSWVYGTRGNNFLLTMLRLGREKTELGVVHDQTGSPTWCREIAKASTHIANALLTEENKPSGLFHLSASGTATWYDFACRIFELCPKELLERVPKVNPIPSQAYPTPAKRPPYSVLSSQKIADTFHISLPDWNTQLALAMHNVKVENLIPAL